MSDNDLIFGFLLFCLIVVSMCLLGCNESHQPNCPGGNCPINYDDHQPLPPNNARPTL